MWIPYGMHVWSISLTDYATFILAPFISDKLMQAIPEKVQKQVQTLLTAFLINNESVLSGDGPVWGKSMRQWLSMAV